MATTVTEDIERDTALYILSYLYNKQYSQTMSSFMMECSHLKILPDQNVMVLPSVPLEEVISDYKGRQSTSILVQSMGSQLAWKSLWDKLQDTLTQINNLAQNLNWKKTPAPPTIGRSRSKLVFSQSTRGPSVQRPSPVVSGSCTPLRPTVQSSSVEIATVQGSLVEIPTVQDYSGPSMEPTLEGSLVQQSELELSSSLLQPSVHSMGTSSLSKSPRKRTQPSKRKQVEPKLSSGEELQNVVDALLHNTELPNKLANLINQRVENEDEQTANALGNMFTSTTDSWLDDIIASTLDQQQQPVDDTDRRDSTESSSSKRARLDNNYPQ